MKELGKILKQKRLAEKLDFDELQEKTKVQKKYLIAIEEGDEKSFPALVYYKSFVRTYANVLGLNPEVLFKECEERIKSAQKEIEAKEEKESFFDSITHKTLKTKKSEDSDEKDNSFSKKEPVSKPGVDNKKLWLTIIVGVLLLFIFIFGNKILNSSDHYIDNSDAQSSMLANQNNPALPVETPIAEKQKLTIEATQGVWLKIDADGKEVFEGIMRAGDKQDWTADNKFNIRIGYTPGVNVFFNGNQVDVQKGAIQDVNTVILKKQSQDR